jgi:hypothetical protein
MLSPPRNERLTANRHKMRTGEFAKQSRDPPTSPIFARDRRLPGQGSFTEKIVRAENHELVLPSSGFPVLTTEIVIGSRMALTAFYAGPLRFREPGD